MMANEGQTTSQLPIQTAPFNANDRVVFIYGVNTIGTGNNVAQTATISIGNLFNTLTIPIGQPDPANSIATTVTQGTIFASNTYLYIATANNYLQRVAFTSF